MEILLLIISDWNLRQLYHELLFSKNNIEVIPIDSIENAILILSLNQIKLAVVYVDNKNITELQVFLNLRKKHKNLLKTKIAIITSYIGLRFRHVSDEDIVLNTDKLTPVEITEKIKDLLIKE